MSDITITGSDAGGSGIDSSAKAAFLLALLADPDALNDLKIRSKSQDDTLMSGAYIFQAYKGTLPQDWEESYYNIAFDEVKLLWLAVLNKPGLVDALVTLSGAITGCNTRPVCKMLVRDCIVPMLVGAGFDSKIKEVYYNRVELAHGPYPTTIRSK